MQSLPWHDRIFLASHIFHTFHNNILNDDYYYFLFFQFHHIDETLILLFKTKKIA